MDRLNISPLRGFIDFWISLSYNLFIPSGLKKMTLKVNRKNMLVTYYFGHKILFDGYLTTSEFLCDGYVTGSVNNKFNSPIINTFLFDGYVIGSPILFDGHLIKEKL